MRADTVITPLIAEVAYANSFVNRNADVVFIIVSPFP
jgi:dTDP-4-amino-4,6-dideoxygalactose transaminase